MDPQAQAARFQCRHRPPLRTALDSLSLAAPLGFLLCVLGPRLQGRPQEEGELEATRTSPGAVVADAQGGSSSAATAPLGGLCGWVSQVLKG